MKMRDKEDKSLLQLTAQYQSFPVLLELFGKLSPFILVSEADGLLTSIDANISLSAEDKATLKTIHTNNCRFVRYAQIDTADQLREFMIIVNRHCKPELCHAQEWLTLLEKVVNAIPMIDDEKTRDQVLVLLGRIYLHHSLSQPITPVESKEERKESKSSDALNNAHQAFMQIRSTKHLTTADNEFIGLHFIGMTPPDEKTASAEEHESYKTTRDRGIYHLKMAASTGHVDSIRILALIVLRTMPHLVEYEKIKLSIENPKTRTLLFSQCEQEQWICAAKEGLGHYKKQRLEAIRSGKSFRIEPTSNIATRYQQLIDYAKEPTQKLLIIYALLLSPGWQTLKEAIAIAANQYFNPLEEARLSGITNQQFLIRDLLIRLGVNNMEKTIPQIATLVNSRDDLVIGFDNIFGRGAASAMELKR